MCGEQAQNPAPVVTGWVGNEGREEGREERREQLGGGMCKTREHRVRENKGEGRRG